MDDFKGRGKGPGKSFGGPRKPYGDRDGARSGGYKPRGEGGYKPREASAEGGERRPYVKREGGFGDGERKPYARREGGFGGGERKPYGDRKPYAPREGGAEGGERRPYVKREGGFGDGERKPYARREGGFGGGERKPYGDRKPYAPREGGAEGGERRPYAKREGGFGGGERKPYGDRKPYARREGGFEGGDRRPYARREGGYDAERRPYDRSRSEGGREAGRFGRTQRVERFEEGRPQESSWEQTEQRGRRQVEFMHPQADGWLVGPHAVKAALKAGRRAVKELWVTEAPAGELAELVAKFHNVLTVIKERSAFDEQFGDLVHQGIALQVGNLPQPELSEILESKPKIIVALDQVTDPHNVGAILRSCAAFGVGAMLLLERRSASVTPVVAKAAAGGLEVVPVVEIVNLSQTLKQVKDAGYTVLGLAGEGELALTSVTVDGPMCIVLGSEGDGLRRLTREGCDHLVRIPQDMGAVGSLNVSNAAAITLYALTR